MQLVVSSAENDRGITVETEFDVANAGKVHGLDYALLGMKVKPPADAESPDFIARSKQPVISCASSPHAIMRV